MRKLVLIAGLAAGCTQYTRTAMTNAPGNVDLTAPLPNENGDPARYEPPRDPGTKTLVMFVAPMLMLGSGRIDAPSTLVVEPGMEFRFESHETGKRWSAPTFAITAGLGFIQIYEARPDHLGAFYSELNFRFPSIKGVVPMDIGIGPAFYAPDAELGGQLTVRLPLLSMRGRYMARNGFEFWAGYEIPIPVIFGRSR